MSPDELTQYLHHHIPLIAAMQARVLRCAPGEIEVQAPLPPNLNHRGTAFGGSLATLGILSGWALLMLELRREGLEARLVIQRSECEFAHPVERDFTALSRLAPPDWPPFLKLLRARGRARISVRTSIRSADADAGAEAVTHVGTYAALAVR